MNDFIKWLLEMGYVTKEDLKIDEKEMEKDMKIIKKKAPKMYNLLMCISNIK